MRIWHQTHGVPLEYAPHYRDALQEHMKAVAGGGVVVDLHGAEPGWVHDNVPQDQQNTRAGFLYPWSLYQSDFVRAALRAEAEGYDAFFVSVILDTGFEETRSLLKIPVIGMFQASMLFAATLGQPISWVLYAPAAQQQLPRLASLYGLHELMGPIVRASFSFTDVMAGFIDPTMVIERFIEAGERAVAQGAKVLVAGEAPLNTLIAREGVSQVAGVPVIDSMGVGIAYAEMRARFYHRTGLTHAQSGFYYATPPRALVDGLQEQYFGSGNAAGV